MEGTASKHLPECDKATMLSNLTDSDESLDTSWVVVPEQQEQYPQQERTSLISKQQDPINAKAVEKLVGTIKTTINSSTINHVNDQENLEHPSLEPVQVNEVEEIDTQEEIPNDGGGDGTDNHPINGETELACIVQDQEMEEDEARSEATFRYTVKNISKIKDLQLSPACYVRNLPWKIMVMPQSNQTQKRQLQRSLGFFLQCNGESKSKSWSCYAVAELRLLSCKEGQEPFSRKIQHLFYNKENDQGFRRFMTWQSVLNPDRGFIKDDSITLEVHLKADVPHGVNSDSKKHMGYVGLKSQDEVKSEATFQYTVENISKMKVSQLSPACYVRNLPWKILVMPRSSQTQEGEPQISLGFFLQCNGEKESKFWSCYAVAELCLLSCKEGQEPFSRKIQHLFCSKENDWGFSRFMAWQDVLDPNRGFIKDDSITLEVHLIADTAINLVPILEVTDSDSDKPTAANDYNQYL